jgi:hypothetical protein
MKQMLGVLTVLLLLTLALPAGAIVTPTFSPAQAIYWGSGQIINVGNNGVIPNVGDWDMDGVKDLMVGVYQSGNIYYYHNTGTNANPVFPSREMLTAGGTTISVTYG